MFERAKNGIVASVAGTGDLVYKTIEGVKLGPKEQEEVLVQRQLGPLLDPGWCMTALVGSGRKSNRKGAHVLWRIAGGLALLGLLGLVTSYPMGGVIHILLMLAIVILLVRLISGRTTNVIVAKENGRRTGSGPATLIDPDDLARFEGEGGLGGSRT